MDYAAHASFLARLKESQGVVHRVRVGEVPIIEAHPIRIVEDCCPAQRLHQFRLVCEVEWAHLDLVAEGVGATGRIGQRAHAMPRL